MIHTSLTVGELALKLRLPKRCTIVLPTASTAPLGLIKLTPPIVEALILKSLIDVPVQMPLTPLFVATSDAYTNPQSKLKYHPSDKLVHWKACTFASCGSKLGFSRLEESTMA